MRKRCALRTAALLTILGATGICCAANAEEPALQGVFSNPTQSEEPIKAAIENALKDLNFIIRPIARSRLKKTNSVLKRIEIHREGKMVSIVLGTGKPTVTEPGHPSVKWTREDGETFDVSTEWQAATLVQRFSTTDGQRENRFSLSADGATLTLRVILSSPQLKSPVQYQFGLQRQTVP